MNEPYLTERCVVLRRTPFRDADAHIVLLGQSCGKVVALAKGVGKAESKLSALLSVGSLVEVELYSGKGGYTLTSAIQIADFAPRYQSYEALLTSVYLCDLADRATEPGIPLTALYALMVKSLAMMDDRNLVEVRLRFEWLLLDLSGYGGATAEDVTALLQAHWRTTHFSLQQQALADELAGFFSTVQQQRGLRLSRRARTVMKDALAQALQQHMGLVPKSKKILDETTAHFYA